MPKQRDVMRRLYHLHGGDKSRVVREYAQAERDGKAQRVKNEYGLTPERYAERLFRDGERKGWVQEGC